MAVVPFVGTIVCRQLKPLWVVLSFVLIAGNSSGRLLLVCFRFAGLIWACVKSVILILAQQKTVPICCSPPFRMDARPTYLLAVELSFPLYI